MNATFPVDRKVEKPLYGRHIANEEGVKTNHWSATEIANETTNMLCHDCNTGWMSVLEGVAKWVLEPMMLGQHRPLSIDEEILAGRWAVKTAMVIEATLNDPEDRFTHAECLVVKDDDRPPASVEIWIAAVDGSIDPLSYACASTAAIVGDDIRQKFHFHTVQAGALVFSILRRNPPPANYGSLESRAVPKELDVPPSVINAIFPPRYPLRDWVPQNVLDWDGVMNMALRGLDIPDEWRIPDEFMPIQPPEAAPE
jgi:hypothetical protein